PGVGPSTACPGGAAPPGGGAPPRPPGGAPGGPHLWALTTTTDATLDQFGLVLLEDDKNLQNADYVVPVVNRARAGSTGVRDALDRLNTVLTTADLASMNEQVDSWRRLPEDVARTYLQSKRLLPKD
ncbi:glycine betaine ABC transporter substrate-binding protein, partial [Streptomyces durocortorensis]|uniref:glycine betaine ABC transporter substrate-binding protein n=1 Tax=Streptomyces durocortorensis TaxID=2811104 RepID=UPI0023B90578